MLPKASLAAFGKTRYSDHTIIGALLKIGGPPHPIAQVTKRDWKQLQRIAGALDLQRGDDVLAQSACHLTVPKQVTYAVTAGVMTRVSTKGPEYLHKTVARLHDKLCEDGTMPELTTRYDELYDSNAEQAVNILDKLVEMGEKDHPLTKNIAILAYLSKKIREGKIRVSRENFDTLRLVVQDALTHHKHAPLVAEAVGSAIAHGISSGQLKALPLVPVEQSTRIILGGAAATGKGHLTKELLEGGIVDPKSTCFFTPDDYHKTVLTVGGHIHLGDDKTLHGDLSHGLVAPLMSAAMRELEKILKKGISPRTVLFEKIVLKPLWLKEGIDENQMVLCVATMHDNMPAVMKGADDRYQSTGRYVSPRYIKEGFAGSAIIMPSAFETALAHSESTGVRIELYNTTFKHDKTLPEPKTPVAVCDANSETTLLFKIDDFIRFNSKKTLNTTDHDSENEKPISDEDMVELFLTDYANVIPSFVFIDPRIEKEQLNKLENFIYAHVDRHTKTLVIDKPDVFRVATTSPMTAQFFEGLERKLQLVQHEKKTP